MHLVGHGRPICNIAGSVFAAEMANLLAPRRPNLLEVRQAYAADDDLVRPDVGRRLEAAPARPRDHAVLRHALAAYAQAANQHAAAIEWRAAGKEDHSALVPAVGGVRALRARCTSVLDEEREEWAGAPGAIDARRKERLRSEADRPVGDGGA